MARVTSLPAMHPRVSEPYLSLLPSRKAASFFGRYPISITLSIGVRVGLGRLVTNRDGVPTEDGHACQY